MREKIIEALEQIRPFLQRDGGDVQFVDYTEDKVVMYLNWYAAETSSQ